MEELLQSVRKTDELWSYRRGGHGENLYPSMKVGGLFPDPQMESADGGHLWFSALYSFNYLSVGSCFFPDKRIVNEFQAMKGEEGGGGVPVCYCVLKTVHSKVSHGVIHSKVRSWTSLAEENRSGWFLSTQLLMFPLLSMLYITTRVQNIERTRVRTPR